MDGAVCISQITNILWIGMHPIIVPSSMDK